MSRCSLGWAATTVESDLSCTAAEACSKSGSKRRDRGVTDQRGRPDTSGRVVLQGWRLRRVGAPTTSRQDTRRLRDRTQGDNVTRRSCRWCHVPVLEGYAWANPNLLVLEPDPITVDAARVLPRMVRLFLQIPHGRGLQPREQKTGRNRLDVRPACCP